MVKREKNKLKQRKTKEIDARRRVELILQVRNGQCTVTDAAAALGVSRKTYYQWEERALNAMFDALTEQEPGRPALPPEVAEARELRQKVQDQREKIESFEHRERLIRKACELKLQMHRGRAEKKCGD